MELGRHTPKLEFQWESEQMQFNGEIIENIKIKHFTNCKDNVSESFISPKLLYFDFYPDVSFVRSKLNFWSVLISRYLPMLDTIQQN